MSDEQNRAPSIPEGTFRARAQPGGVKWGESPAHHPQISVPYRFSADEFNDAAGIAGRTILAIDVLGTDKSIEILCKSLAASGWTGVDPRDGLPGLGLCEVDLVIVHEKFDGKWRAKVRYVNAIGGAGFEFKKPLAPAAFDRLADRMRQIRTGERPTATPPPDGDFAPDPGYPTPPDDDDIPF